jgi:hypothetical protein
MAITTQTMIDAIQPLLDGQIQVRQALVILSDGVEIPGSRTFTRWVVVPGQDVSTQDSTVQAVANTLWTPTVVSAYQAAVAAQNNPPA